jgi:Tfp pilus assembly pilus retraction ATPase PilT
MVPALEIVINTDRIREMIEQPVRTREIKTAIEEGLASVRHGDLWSEPGDARQERLVMS